MKRDQHQGQVFPDMPGEQEILPHELACGRSHPIDPLLVMEQVPDPMGRPFGGVHEKPGMVVHHLEADPADVPADRSMSQSRKTVEGTGPLVYRLVRSQRAVVSKECRCRESRRLCSTGAAC